MRASRRCQRRDLGDLGNYGTLRHFPRIFLTRLQLSPGLRCLDGEGLIGANLLLPVLKGARALEGAGLVPSHIPPGCTVEGFESHASISGQGSW